MHWFSGSRLLTPGLSWLFERAELGELKGRKGLLSFWVKYFWISSSSLKFFLGKRPLSDYRNLRDMRQDFNTAHLAWCFTEPTILFNPPFTLHLPLPEIIFFPAPV